jgi:hypothetical protein
MRRFFREACVVVLLFAFSACDQQGCSGCEGCGIEQIPGGFPLENRIPNAGQMRLTTHGIDFIEANMAQIVSQFLPDGLSFPIPQSSMDFAGFNAEVCPHGDCFVDLEITDVSLDPRAPNMLAVALRMIVSTRNLSLGVDLGFDCPNCEWNGFGWDCSTSTLLECTVGVDTRWENPEDVGVTVNILFTTDPHTGYTEVAVEDPQLSDDLTGGDFEIAAAGGCFLDGVCSIGNIGFLKDLLIPLIAPARTSPPARTATRSRARATTRPASTTTTARASRSCSAWRAAPTSGRSFRRSRRGSRAACSSRSRRAVTARPTRA